MTPSGSFLMEKSQAERDIVARCFSFCFFPVKQILPVPVDKPRNGFEDFQNCHGAIGIYIINYHCIHHQDVDQNWFTKNSLGYLDSRVKHCTAEESRLSRFIHHQGYRKSFKKF
jgi:hypothetical protein